MISQPLAYVHPQAKIARGCSNRTFYNHSMPNVEIGSGYMDWF